MGKPTEFLVEFLDCPESMQPEQLFPPGADESLWATGAVLRLSLGGVRDELAFLFSVQPSPAAKLV